MTRNAKFQHNISEITPTKQKTQKRENTIIDTLVKKVTDQVACCVSRCDELRAAYPLLCII